MTKPMLPPRIEALLPVPLDIVREAVAHRAREIGFEVEMRASGLFIPMAGGEMEIRAEGDGARLSVTAQDIPHLQMLRDFLTEEIAAAGITPEWQGHRAVGRPDSHALARVVAVRRISPSYCRVTVEGADLARFAEGGLHFRLLFGPEGADWPTTDANGVTQWPGGMAAWHRPVYTTRSLSGAGGTTRLDFDVFLHEGGRVTGWCEGLEAGTGIVLAGPGGDKGPRRAGWQGLVGDETAVPVIARFLSLLPQDARGQAVLVVPCAEDIQPLDHPPGVRVRWELRNGGLSPLEALEALDIPPEDRAVFFAAEQAEAQAARKALAARGLDKGEFTAAGYWSRKTS